MKQISSLIKKALSCTMQNWYYVLLTDWHTIMGPLSKRMYLLKVDQATLCIAVYDVHWMQELKMMSSDILKLIHLHTEAIHLTNIRFFIHRFKIHQQKSVPIVSAIVPQPHFLLKHSQALNLIHDQSIRDALLKLFYTRTHP